jgi:cytoskeletal protein RodZ
VAEGLVELIEYRLDALLRFQIPCQFEERKMMKKHVRKSWQLQLPDFYYNPLTGSQSGAIQPEMTMLPFLILLLPTLISGFVVQPARIAGGLQFHQFHKNNGLYMSGEEDGTASLTNRRRKRKTKVEDDSEAGVMEEEKEAEPELDWKPRNSAGVSMQVRDVREIVGGVASTSAPSASAPSVSATNLESAVMAASASSDDSFKQMLEDAKLMQDDYGDDVESEPDNSIKAKVRNVLSTIVTADFFVVLFFLAWFLSGIAYRAVFDDAALQIAFNSKYLSRLGPSIILP